MVLDSLDNCGRYERLHPAFRTAFKFLKDKQLAGLPDGQYAINGRRSYAVVLRCKGGGKKSAKLEVHKRYIDIQFSLAGADRIGWRPARECKRRQGGFNAKKDCGFFSDAPRAWITLAPQTFVIFFPEDAHAPSCGRGNLHKIVVKVAVDLPHRT